MYHIAFEPSVADTHLSGPDFDNVPVAHFVKQFKRTNES